MATMDDLESIDRIERNQCDSPFHSPARTPEQAPAPNLHFQESKPKVFPSFVVLVTFVNWLLYIYGVIFLIDNAHVTLSSPISPPISSWYFYTVTSYPNCEDARDDAVRSFMYQFVHSGMMHLCGNTLAALTYGVIYNLYSGSGLLVTGVVYETAVYVGGLGHSLVWPYKGLIGCSPGVYGLIGGCWVLVIFNRHKLDHFVAFVLPIVLAAQLVGDIVSYLVMFSSGIGYASHFFGFCTGITLSLTFLLWDSKRDDVVRKGFGVLGLCGFVLVLSFVVSHSQQNWPPEPFVRPFLHNADFASCCSQLLHYAKDSDMSVDAARSQTYCYDDVLYQKD